MSNRYFLLKIRLNKGVNRNHIILFFMAVILFLGILLPVFVPRSSLKEIPSFYRRSNLLVSSFKLIKNNYLFGMGFGESTRYIEMHMPRSPDIRFVQPVHNIFVLLFVEAGVFVLIAFLYLLYLMINKSFKLPVIFIVWLLQFVILGSFDHYFITMPQTLIFMVMVFGMINSIDVKDTRALDKELNI